MFDTLINLTPHPVVVYPPDAPDTVSLGTVTPNRVIDCAGEPARLVETGFDEGQPAGNGAAQVPVYHVRYLPQHVTGLPQPADSTGYIVSLPVALARPDRNDLLVPFREVRNRTGTVIGCRALSRPSTETLTTASTVENES